MNQNGGREREREMDADVRRRLFVICLVWLFSRAVRTTCGGLIPMRVWNNTHVVLAVIAAAGATTAAAAASKTIGSTIRCSTTTLLLLLLLSLTT